MTLDALPVLRCPKRSFGAEPGGPARLPWPELAPFSLCGNRSGGVPVVPAWGKAAWSGERLHLLFGMEEAGEAVTVLLDPVGDLEAYFALKIGRSNTVDSAVLRRFRSGFKRNAAWRCEGLRNAIFPQPAGGWSVELSIPFASLAALPAGKCWRANFFGGSPGGEQSAWSPTRSGNIHVPSRFGWLELSE